MLGLIAAPNRGYTDFGVPGWGARRYGLFDQDEGTTLTTRSFDTTVPLVMSSSALHREERVQVMMNRL